MHIGFDGRVAIVTGAGGGLGRSYALKLAERGARVVVNDLGSAVAADGSRSRSADAVVAEIRSRGGEAIASYDSVSDPDGAARIVAAAVDGFGRLDILINNAGNLFQAPLTEMPVDQCRSIVEVHLLGAIFMTRAALPHMQAGRYGRVVFTSSGSGLVGFAGQAAYGAAKTAMVGLMHCLVLETENEAVRFNTIVPTATSKMSDGILPGHLTRFLGPEAVAPAVLWLSSDRCDVNGRILVAGGGFFAQVELMRSPGILVDPTGEITPETYDERFAEIAQMTGATRYAANLTNLENQLKQHGLL